MGGIGMGRVHAEDGITEQALTPGQLPCSSLPHSVATQTVTSAPAAASFMDSSLPSVVPLKMTSFMPDTPVG